MILNMRDLGGLRARDGRLIRPGLLIRSAHLFRADEADLAGISAVIDLRTPAERQEAPDRTFGRACYPMPIFDDRQAGISHEQGASQVFLPDMALLYRRLMAECAASFAAVLRAIFSHDYASGAVLWHCTEGKDRCGMTTALVLEALGVPREMILEDYLKTNLVSLPKAVQLRTRLTRERGQAYADSVFQAYIADERYLRAAWEEMGDGYIEKKLRISQHEIEAFQSKVLERA